jgi:hypothetical protein
MLGDAAIDYLIYSDCPECLVAPLYKNSHTDINDLFLAINLIRLRWTRGDLGMT